MSDYIEPVYDSTASTLEHKRQVTKYMNVLIQELIKRAEEHDNTKLEEPEKELFDKYTPMLSKTVYNSPEYLEQMAGLAPALEHHYARNRHHPEHFKRGVKDMDLVDLVELICDWKAATLRQRNGNILKSIEDNSTRFEYGKELSNILVNTVDLFE